MPAQFALALHAFSALAAPSFVADTPPSPPAAAAASRPESMSPGSGVSLGEVLLAGGGAAAALLAHEAGHVASNLALGNTPRLESVSFLGFVPFFAVSPGIACAGDSCFRRNGTRFGAGRRGLGLILLAGFDVQHITDEVLLTADPALRLHHAPFRTGLLAFNTLTSAAYVIGNLTGIEPSAGDLQDAFRDAHASRVWTIGLLIGIAGLDAVRWACPEVGWLAWVSRAAKVAFLGLPLTV